MSFNKFRYRYEAYKALDGQFPMNIVLFHYKGLRCTKEMFKMIEGELFHAQMQNRLSN